MSFPRTALHWQPSYRVVPSRFPPIDLFERVAEPDDWALLNQLEGETSARLREEAGAIHMVPEADRRYGQGWTSVMAAFCHFSGQGSRFSNGSFGVYYCARTEAMAIAETRYHVERFMKDSSEPPMQLQQRVYLSELQGELVDLRDNPEATLLLVPESWQAGQAFGLRLREEGADGIVYPSVRDPEGECTAVLRPPVMSATRQGRHLGHEWDGERIRHVLALTWVG